MDSGVRLPARDVSRSMSVRNDSWRPSRAAARIVKGMKAVGKGESCSGGGHSAPLYLEQGLPRPCYSSWAAIEVELTPSSAAGRRRVRPAAGLHRPVGGVFPRGLARVHAFLAVPVLIVVG